MMDEQAYHTSAREALVTLRMAIEEAKALLPASVLTRHWMAGHFSPAAWRSVEAAYRNQDDADPAISEILTDLKNISEAVSALESVQATSEQVPLSDGWQRLAKMKRLA